MLLFAWAGIVSGVLAAYPLHRAPWKLPDEANYTISDLRASASLADGRSDFVGHFGLREAHRRDVIASCRVDMGDSSSPAEEFVRLAKVHLLRILSSHPGLKAACRGKAGYEARAEVNDVRRFTIYLKHTRYVLRYPL